MGEYKDNNSEYEPNFVMTDPEPSQTSADIAQDSAQDTDTENVNAYADGFKRNGDAFESTLNEDQPDRFANAYQGTADDTPLENIGSTQYEDASFGQQTQQGDFFGDPRENFRSGDSYTWSAQDGLGKVKRPFSADHKRRSKKVSPPINFTRKTLAMIIILCVVVSGAFGFGGAALGNTLFDGDSSSDGSSGSAHSTGYTLESATGSSMTVQEITDKAKKSVVEIKTESVSSDSWMQQYVTEGAGSGVIISDDGYIITNNHVIDGASKITVTTASEKEYDAKLVGTDSNSDVAVLKIKASDLTPATYGNSDEIAVGDLAVAIGNPLGELGGTVTAGIISALDRELSIDGKTMSLLQTDSSINPGNSGGGLFNSEGQLIGIVVAKSSGSDVEGLGFAIPINEAAEVAQQLQDNGYVSGQPYTGMTYTEGNQTDSFDSFFGGETESESMGSSVYIYSVDSSTAKRAGFEAGDQVFAVDGKQITSVDDLSSIVTSHEVGDKLEFTIVRDGQTKDITLKLQEKKGE